LNQADWFYRVLKMKQQLIIFAVILTILTGCTGIPVYDYSDLKADSKAYNCLKSYQIIDNVIAQERVNDAEGYRLPGFPYLRSNRFLSSLTDKKDFHEHSDAWLDQLIKLDQQGRQIELRNLPDNARDRLENRLSSLVADNMPVDEIIDQCPAFLKQLDLQ